MYGLADAPEFHASTCLQMVCGSERWLAGCAMAHCSDTLHFWPPRRPIQSLRAPARPLSVVTWVLELELELEPELVPVPVPVPSKFFVVVVALKHKLVMQN